MAPLCVFWIYWRYALSHRFHTSVRGNCGSTWNSPICHKFDIVQHPEGYTGNPWSGSNPKRIVHNNSKIALILVFAIKLIKQLTTRY